MLATHNVCCRLLKHGSRAIIVGTAIFWGPLCVMIALHDCITAKEYEAILQNEVPPVVQMLLLREVCIWQDGNTIMQTTK